MSAVQIRLQSDCCRKAKNTGAIAAGTGKVEL